VDIEVGGGGDDDPGREFGDVGTCEEQAVVMEVADVVDDPVGLGGEGVVGGGGDPGGAGVVDRVRGVSLECLFCCVCPSRSP